MRYGYLDLGASTVRHAQITVGSPFSYEFNGSLGVGLNADGTEAIFLSWDYTVPASGIQVSDAVDAFVWNGGAAGWPPDTQGQEDTLVTGSTSGEVGAYSSVAVEPATFGVTTCAVTTQMYRDSGAWKTRLARVCSPTTVNVPDVTGRTVAQAAAILAPYDLSVGAQTATSNCDPAAADGLIMGSSPAHNQPAPLGSSVGVTLCRRIVPNVLGETVSNASADIQAAGLQVGAISTTSDCDQSAAGTVTVTVPPSGTALPYQSFVGLTWCAPLPPPPPSGIVPPLIGFTRDQAAQQLNAAGFVLGTVRTMIDNSCEFLGTVMSQSPAGGSHASRGSSVNITIGRALRTCGL